MSARPARLESIDVGDIRITYIPDGDVVGSATAVFPSSDEALWQAHRQFLDADGKLVMTLGGFLVEVADRKIVIDLGFGDMTAPFPPLQAFFRGGSLLENLERAGVQAADVDTVVFTHMHFDHVGWTSRDGALTFPNARYMAGEGELEFWGSVTNADLAALGPHADAVQSPLGDRLETMRDGGAVAPGVTVLASPGHTPGHCSVVVSSGAERAIILGDVVHCPLQLTMTDMAIIADVDPAAAARTREAIVSELDGDERMIGAAGHFSGSVFGRLLPVEGRTWVRL
jgi:glyoxylase-like metal-dependent hydrolase (beta-lactamase superfamily II)